MLSKNIFRKIILLTLLSALIYGRSAAQHYYEFKNSYAELDSMQREAAITELSAKHFKKPTNTLFIKMLAEAFSAKKEVDSAITYWLLLGSIQPSNDTAFYALARLFYNTNNLDSASQMIQKSANLKPDRIDYIELEAQIDYRMQKADDALQLCDKILALSPTDVNALLLSGIILRDQKKNDAAMERFQNCLKVDPANTEALVYRAEQYLLAKKYTDALRDYSAARADLSINPDILNNIGICHYQSSAFQQAIVFFKKAISLDRLHPQSYFNEGLSYYHLNDIDTASARIKTASAIWDTCHADTCHTCYLDAIYYLGLCYKKIGDLPAAKTQFELLQKEKYSKDLSSNIKLIDYSLFISRNWYYILAVLILTILLILATVKVVRKK